MSVTSSLTYGGLLTARDALTSKVTTTEGYDSGYGSRVGMDRRERPHGFQPTVEGVALPQHGLIERKVKLRVFNEEIPKSTQHRFADLYELLETPLYDYLKKAKAKSSGHAIKLKVMGECEDAARPWILVLCHKTVSKWMKRFFSQSQIKVEYKPSSADPYRASFQICICNGLPKLMAATEMIEVYGDWDEHATLCGQVIGVGKPHQTRIATLGGVIQVVASDASYRSYGMTAGHIVNQVALEESEQDGSSDHEDNEDQESTDTESEGSQTSEGVHGWGTGVELAGVHDELAVAVQSSPVLVERVGGHLSWPLKGHVSVASDPTHEPDLDWALLEFDDKGTMDWPNIFSWADHRLSGPLKELDVVPMETDRDRTVVLVSGIGGLKPGTLSTSVTYLNMGRTKTSTKTYTLLLSPNVVLDPGDCGSWVVDHETNEVYGYVVASDILGEIYVVPLHAALDDITTKLAARSAYLPTGRETQGPVNQHSKMVLFDPSSTAQQPHRPPPPNPFLTLPALERLRADIDLVSPAIDLSLQCLPYNVGDHPDGYDEKPAKNEHQVRNPSKVAPSDLRDGESPYHTTLSSSKPSYDQHPGLKEPRIADEEGVFSSQSHHSGGRSHDAARHYSKGALFSYEGYTLTREAVENVGRQRTWAYCRRDPMDVTQEYLKERLKNERRGLVSNQYNSPEMDGFKRYDVDRLLYDQNAKEMMNESGYEYGLASVKLQGQVEDGHVTPTCIDVILQRRPCPDIGPWLSVERVSTPEATILTIPDSTPRTSVVYEPTKDSTYGRISYRDEFQEPGETRSSRDEDESVSGSFTEDLSSDTAITSEPDLTFEEIYGPRRPANSINPPSTHRKRGSSVVDALLEQWSHL